MIAQKKEPIFSHSSCRFCADLISLDKHESYDAGYCWSAAGLAGHPERSHSRPVQHYSGHVCISKLFFWPWMLC